MVDSRMKQIAWRGLTVLRLYVRRAQRLAMRQFAQYLKPIAAGAKLRVVALARGAGPVWQRERRRLALRTRRAVHRARAGLIDYGRGVRARAAAERRNAQKILHTIRGTAQRYGRRIAHARESSAEAVFRYIQQRLRAGAHRTWQRQRGVLAGRRRLAIARTRRAVLAYMWGVRGRAVAEWTHLRTVIAFRRRSRQFQSRARDAARHAAARGLVLSRAGYAHGARYVNSLIRRATADTGSGYPVFFLLAAVCAAAQIPIWLLIAGNKGVLPAEAAPLLWHAHENLFGFISAFLTGFLLTAIAAMTGRPPIRGLRLRIIIVVWLAGRAAWWIPGSTPSLALLIDLLFVPLVIAFAWRDLVQANRPRTHLIVGTLIFYWLGKLVALSEPYLNIPDVVNPGLNMSMDAVTFMIAVVAGSVAPIVTERALGRDVDDERQLLDAPPMLDVAALSSLGLFIVFDVTMPLSEPTGWLAVVAGALNLVRMAFWRGYLALDKPVVWIVHLSYLWLCLGLFALAGAYIGGWYSGTVGRHALTIGAVATGCLAVMTRETLDHSARVPKVGIFGVAAYLLISVAVVVRVAAGLVLPAKLNFWLLVGAGGAFTLAFVAYLAGYGRALIVRARRAPEHTARQHDGEPTAHRPYAGTHREGPR